MDLLKELKKDLKKFDKSIKNIDMDADGVPNTSDCQPLNPEKDGATIKMRGDYEKNGVFYKKGNTYAVSNKLAEELVDVARVAEYI